MNIVSEVFKKSFIDMTTLKSYGFIKDGDIYRYQIEIADEMDGVMEVKEDGSYRAYVYDKDMQEEYMQIDIMTQTGAYVTSIRHAFINFLFDIKDHCFKKTWFRTLQADRITSSIIDEYGDEPSFMFSKKDDKDSGVFKDPLTKKWYGIIMDIPYRKLGIDKLDKVEVINVKLEPDLIDELVKRDGYHRAYHMNKRYWITIRLDETISDDEIMSLVAMSHSFLEDGKNEWIVPANPAFFDIFAYCDTNEIISWHTIRGIKEGDIVYLYITAPIKALMYRYEVISTDNKDMDNDGRKGILLKRMKKYTEGEFTYKVLNDLGIKSIRGPRKVTDELSEALKLRS